MNRIEVGPARRAVVAFGAADVVVLAWWLSKPSRRRRAGRRLRYWEGRGRGWVHRTFAHQPTSDVSDEVLCQRVRSELGLVTKRLDLPRVHLAVLRRIVLLHGDVATDAEADEIERAAHAVPSVDGVLSYLRIGLAPSDTRPSDGAAVYVPSPALHTLLAAAESAGVGEATAGAAVHAVLAPFMTRLPDATRAHLVAHLPRDVQIVMTPARRRGSVRRVRRLDDFVAAVLAADHLPSVDIEQVAVAVLGALRELVPEEQKHVAAVLPRELRALWEPETFRPDLVGHR